MPTPAPTRSATPPGTAPASRPYDGPALYDLVARLFPLRRCVTGAGLRQTLAVLAKHVPLAVTEVPSGTAVLDWTVPPEWRVRQAYVAVGGRRVADWDESPLHLVQYSVAVRERMPLSALRAHLHTLPDRPDWVPYRTAYYAPTWGFCLSQNALDRLADTVGEDGECTVVIDADHDDDGALSYGEAVVPGETAHEILLSAHACHPALANDNASALAVGAALARRLLDGPPLRAHGPGAVRARYDWRRRLAQSQPGAAGPGQARAGARQPGRRRRVHLQTDPARHAGRPARPRGRRAGRRPAPSRS